MQVCGIAAFGTAIATIFKPNWSPVTAPLYAAVKGFTLGMISFYFEMMYPGIAMSAVLLTLGTAGGLLGLFKSGVISVSDRVRSIISTAVVGVMLSYLARALLGLVGVRFGFLTGGPMAIGFGLLTTGVAASCLLLDFDSLQRMEYARMPRWMEWYGGFSILVTLVWLYVEFLNLLRMFQSKRD